MSTSLSLLAASALFAAAAALTVAPQTSYAAAQTAAADSATKAPAKVRTPQQQRMADCNHQAKAEGKKGPERKAFMSTCLKGSHTAAAGTASPHKAKSKAKAKTGSKASVEG